jgi:HTH-type transcriptional regulator/antitoxin HipB
VIAVLQIAISSDFPSWPFKDRFLSISGAKELLETLSLLFSYPVFTSPTWRRYMMTFDSHLKEKMKNKRFRRMYEEEKELLDISLKILEARTEQNLSQAELANRAHITQQQLSRIENGMNFNIKTLLKLCDALDLSIDLKQRSD